MKFPHRYLLTGVAALGIASTALATTQPDTTIKYYDSWNKSCKANNVVTHGIYKDTPLRWYSKWWPELTDEPGTIGKVPVGTPWCLINNRNFTPITSGNPLTLHENDMWVGENISAPKIRVKKSGTTLIYDTLGTWEDNTTQNSIGSVPNTWKGGTEGAYVMIHEGFGNLPYTHFIEPILNTAEQYPDIKTTLAVSVPDMDDTEWEKALSAAIKGHELVVGNSHLTLMNDVFEIFNIGDTLTPSAIKYIPKQFHGAVVGYESGSYVEKSFSIPSLDYPNGVSAEPETLWTDITLEVSRDFGNTGKSVVINGETVDFPGTIKPSSLIWDDNFGAEIAALKLKTVPALDEDKFIDYLKNCRDEINDKVYSQIVTITIHPAPAVPTCEIYYSGRYNLSLRQRAKIKESGFLASLGGWNESRQITPSEFVHPGYINVDFYDGYDDDINSDEISYFGDSQAYTLSNLPVRAADMKGVVIRGLSGVTSTIWDSFTGKAPDHLSFRILHTNQLENHYAELNALIDLKRVAVYTPSELIKSKLAGIDGGDNNPVAIENGATISVDKFSVQQNGSALTLSLPQGVYNLNIYSISGRLLHQQNLQSANGMVHSLSLANFAKGILLMQVNQGDKTVLKQKIVK